MLYLRCSGCCSNAPVLGSLSLDVNYILLHFSVMNRSNIIFSKWIIIMKKCEISTIAFTKHRYVLCVCVYNVRRSGFSRIGNPVATTLVLFLNNDNYWTLFFFSKFSKRIWYDDLITNGLFPEDLGHQNTVNVWIILTTGDYTKNASK